MKDQVFSPGLTPVEYKILVYPLPVDDVASGGLIVKAEVAKDRERLEQTRGILVAVGDLAYTDWECKVKPVVGDEVEFSKFAGQFYNGSDDKEYKVMLDKDIVGIIK